MPAKVITEILDKYATAPKSNMQALEDHELSIVFEHLTQNNQISNIAAIYADEPKKPEAPKVEAPKAEAPKAQSAAAQRRPQGDAQGRGGDDGHRGVEDGGGELQRQGGQGHHGLEPLHQDAVVGHALEEVEDVVGHATQHGPQQASGVGQLLVVDIPGHHQARHRTHQTLGEKGDPALGGVEGVGQVIEGGAQAGGQAADGAQQQARKAADDVGQGEGGPASDGDGHDDAGIVAGKDQRGHHPQEGQLPGGKTLFHNAHSLDRLVAFLSACSVERNPVGFLHRTSL